MSETKREFLLRVVGLANGAGRDLDHEIGVVGWEGDTAVIQAWDDDTKEPFETVYRVTVETLEGMDMLRVQEDQGEPYLISPIGRLLCAVTYV